MSRRARGYDLKPARAATDSKAAAHGFDEDKSASSGHVSPRGESGGERTMKTSKWQGSGQKARH